MDTVNFQDYWNSHYPLCPPVGYIIRETYRERWFRIHALPESKRYPETEAEYQEILHRHNTLITDLLQGNREIFLITAGYSNTSQPVAPENIDLALFPSTWSMSLAMGQIGGDDFGDNTYWHLWTCAHEWRSGSLDVLFRLVADDLVRNVLIVDPKQNFVYHPYDGGADVVMASQIERERFRMKYSQWLSPYPSGM